MGILKKISRGLCLLVGLVSVSCTSATHTMLVRMPAIKQNDPKRIQVFMDAPPRRASALAVVSAGRDGENATWAIEVLKIEAAELGADAITHVKLNYSTGIFPSLRAQAVAVKYDQ